MIELLLAPVLLVTSAGPVSSSGYLPNSADLKVEQSARDFRIQVYETFRSDRPEYERRRLAGNLVTRVYRESRHSTSQREAVLDWFAAAQTAAKPGKVGPLPEFPDFVKQAVGDAVTQVMPPPSPTDASPQRRPTPANSSTTARSNPAQPRSAPRSNSLFSRLRAAIVGGAQATPDSATEPKPNEVVPPPTEPLAEPPSVPAPVPVPATNVAQLDAAEFSPPDIELGQVVETQTSERPAASVAPIGSETPQQAIPVPAANPAVVHESTPPPAPSETTDTQNRKSIPVAPAAPTVPEDTEQNANVRTPQVEPPADTKVPFERPTPAVPPSDEPTREVRSTGATTKGDGTIEEPLADDVAPAPVESAPPAAPAEADSDLVATAQTNAQFPVLTDRVADFNDSLRQFENKLSDASPPRVFDIARWLNHLAELAEQRRQVAADFAGLPATDRLGIAELGSTAPACTRLTEKIEAARFRVRTTSFPGGVDERQQALDLLDVLARQLEQLIASP